MTRRHRALLSTAATVASLSLLAGCGGSVAGSGDGGDADGFAFGSDQAEVDAAIADLDPVTLTIQPYAASPDAAAAIAEQSFMDAVEERSGGKITFDVAWGQSIAGYSEVDDALADELLLDCRSADYRAAWPGPRERIVTVDVVQVRGGKRTVVSHFAKHTRGELVGRLLRSPDPLPATPEDLATAASAFYHVELTQVPRKPASLTIVLDEG